MGVHSVTGGAGLHASAVPAVMLFTAAVVIITPQDLVILSTTHIRNRQVSYSSFSGQGVQQPARAAQQHTCCEQVMSITISVAQFVKIRMNSRNGCTEACATRLYAGCCMGSRGVPEHLGFVYVNTSAVGSSESLQS